MITETYDLIYGKQYMVKGIESLPQTQIYLWNPKFRLFALKEVIVCNV